MHWNDLIERVMIDNGGSASLSLLYQEAHKYRRLPRGDWKKTLRGVLYRDVKKGRFTKVGLAVYGLPGFSVEDSAYSAAVSDKSSRDFIIKTEDPHSTIEGMLIELGNFHKFLTYTSDKNKTFDGKSLSSIEGLRRIPEFTYGGIMKIVRRMDVIWFLGRPKYVFPKYLYEVEHSADFTNSMLKMFQLKDFDATFVLASWDSKRRMFDDRMDQEPFHEVKDKFIFRSFELISEFYFSAVKHFELEAKYFER